MDTGIHPRMKTLRLLGRVLGAAALALALAACAHRAPASSAVPLAALQPPAPPEPGPTYRIQLGDELHVPARDERAGAGAARRPHLARLDGRDRRRRAHASRDRARDRRALLGAS